MKKDNNFKELGLALEDLVSGLGIKDKIQEYDAVVNWDAVVGANVAKMATAVCIKKGVLFVRVKTSTWRNELSLCKKEIINKLNNVVGVNVVKDIKFH